MIWFLIGGLVVIFHMALAALLVSTWQHEGRLPSEAIASALEEAATEVEATAGPGASVRAARFRRLAQVVRGS